jgi:folylpolyglutamate synthase/dihydropteroate synthase
MDDFLHNLRTGKRFDRNRKPHDVKFQAPDRQRSRDSGDGTLLKAISGEHIPALKAILEGIAESEKRIADAAERRVAAEERKAEAMETIAKHIKEIFSAGNSQKEEFQQINEQSPEKEPAPRRKPRVKTQPENNQNQS